MKLWHELIEKPMDIKNDAISVLTIENHKVFRKIVGDLYKELHGENTGLIISENNNEINYKKEVYLLDNPLQFDDSSRGLWSPIFKSLGILSKSDQLYAETSQVIDVIEEWIERLIFESDYPITFDREISVDGLIKSIQLQTLMQYSENDIEFLIDYIDFVRQVFSPKLLILLQFKSYFGKDEIPTIYEYLLQNEINCLLIESIDRKYYNENVRIVDADGCII